MSVTIRFPPRKELKKVRKKAVDASKNYHVTFWSLVKVYGT